MSGKYPFMDFFAGSGLVTESLKDFFDLVWANDIDLKKADVFMANNPGAPFLLDSIKNVNGSQLPEAVLSWASFPCQDLSIAGNLEGINGKRSGLVWEWLRVLDEMKVRSPLLTAENVSGLVNADSGAHYLELHHALIQRGYRVGAIEINASHWVPQSRPRIFVIAIQDTANLYGMISPCPNWAHPQAIRELSKGLKNWVWWSLPKPAVTRQELDTLMDYEIDNVSCDWSEHNVSLIPQYHLDRMMAEIQKGRKFFLGYRRIRNHKQVLELRFDGLAGCLRTPNGGSSKQIVVFQKNGKTCARLLSVVEAARLMGVSPTYKFPGKYNDGYRALGDAVAVPAVRFIGEHLLYPLARRVTGECLRGQRIIAQTTHEVL